MKVPLHSESPVRRHPPNNKNHIRRCGFYYLVEISGIEPLTSKTACDFCWKDVDFGSHEDELVFIKYRRDNTAGATHNFTSPLFPFGSQVLRKRYAYLLTWYSDKELTNMPVASMAKDPKKPLDPKKLTELCRTELTRIGIELSTVHRLSKLDTNRLGVGIMLYLQTYEYKLREHCHLDEAAINFMCHRMMQSVQADYYRCFVDDSARHYLSTALARCHRGEKVYRRKKNEQIVSNLEDDTEYITVYPSSDLDVASVILTFKTKDEPIIDINCVGGCRYHAQRLTA